MADPGEHYWLDRHRVLDPEHGHDLEAAAAVHEFRHRLPRAEAEAQAYQGYLRDRALDAAAHHLLGVRGAHAAGQAQVAAQHGAAYAGAMQAAGLDPNQAPPPAVLDRARALGAGLYRFKGHPADVLWTATTPEADGGDRRIADLLERLRVMREGLRDGEGDVSDR